MSNKSQLKILLYLLLGCLLPLFAGSQTRYVKGLESLITMADSANPHLRESLREQELSTAQWRFAREWWLPDLSAGVSTHQLTGIAMNGNGNFYLDVSRDNLWAGLGLEAKWNVRSGPTRVRLAGVNRDLSGFQHRARRNEVLLEIADAYFGLLLARHSLRVLDSLAKRSEEISEQLLVQVRNGLAYSSDHLLFQSGTRRIHSEILNVHADEERLSIALSALLGLAPETEWIFEDSLALPLQDPSGSTAEIEQIVAAQPELRAAELRIQAARLSEKQFRQERHFPTVGLRASSALFGRPAKKVNPVQAAQYPETHALYPTSEINLSLSWQIPLGHLLYGGQRKLLTLQRRLTEDQFSTLSAARRAELLATQRTVHLLAQQCEHYRQAESFAKEALDQSTARIALGVVRPMESLEAMESLLLAQRKLFDALAKLNFEFFRLRLACFGPLNNQTKLHIKKCNLCLWKSENSAVRRSLKSSKKPWDRA